MAASVPVLRSLLRSKTKYKPPTPSPAHKIRFNPESFTMQSQSTVVIESRRRSHDKERGSRYWKSESRSTRGSLDLQPQEGTILQISEVAVEYSRKDEEMGLARP
jgi:hypothetical protein